MKKRFSSNFTDAVWNHIPIQRQNSCYRNRKIRHHSSKLFATFNSGTCPYDLCILLTVFTVISGFKEKKMWFWLFQKAWRPSEIRRLSHSNFSGLKLFLLAENSDSNWFHFRYFSWCICKEEACPRNLAPTSSTAALVPRDTLYFSSSERDFTSWNFAFVHPGGNLGKTSS